jgi:hypothetical protein
MIRCLDREGPTDHLACRFAGSSPIRCPNEEEVTGSIRCMP